MKMCRFTHKEAVRTGVIEDETVKETLGSTHEGAPPTGTEYLLSEVRLLPPCLPGKIVAVGVNYHVHALHGHAIPEEPLIFLKPPSAVVGPGDGIVFPKMARRVDFEGELGVVIGKRAEHVSAAEAPSRILGYTCANDVTARDIQDKEGSFGRAKGFDTFAPFGPWIETELDPADVLLETFLNGERKQSSSTSDMVFSVPEIVAFISRVMTLNPGDLVMTGTPHGMGPMSAGDTVEVRIEGIGTLRNTLVLAADA